METFSMRFVKCFLLCPMPPNVPSVEGSSGDLLTCCSPMVGVFRALADAIALNDNSRISSYGLVFGTRPHDDRFTSSVGKTIR